MVVGGRRSTRSTVLVVEMDERERDVQGGGGESLQDFFGCQSASMILLLFIIREEK
jgi:hypothetical protein